MVTPIPILSLDMDLTTLEPEVTKIELANSRGGFLLKIPGTVEGLLLYDKSGAYIGTYGSLPPAQLRLRQPTKTIDWTKPIREKDLYGSHEYWVKSTAYVREPGAVPCVIIGQPKNRPDIFRTLDNKPLPDDQTGSCLRFENAPPEPVRRSYVLRRDGGFASNTATPTGAEFKIEVTTRDGIATDVRLVTPNRTPFA